MTSTDLLGWAATALFTCSYLARGAGRLRWIQAAAALLWIAYGVSLHAEPVVAANAIVAVAAVGSSFLRRKGEGKVGVSGAAAEIP